jgi:DNA polymerase III subunit alpha
MSGLEKLALLKMDFLGLTTLTIITEALSWITKTRGISIDLEQLPLDDAGTYELFSRGHTSGVFQFESRGMRDILKRYQPSRIEDLIALNALYRPGPIQGGMIDDFIDRKHGRKAVTYDLPELKEILEETLGVIVYQEQVMQIANRIAGYSLGEADLLRRAMGKKKAEEMAKQRERFLEGAEERKHPRKKAEKLFELMEQFAGYGFNKSHSAAYAYLAYITAYLKTHYGVEFMAALLTSETGNTAKVVKYISECRELGIRVLPPDVNYSEWNFTPDGDAIRFGLGAIKNVGQNAVEAIMEARRAKGAFRTLYEFCERVPPQALNRRLVESLIRAGAMDGFEGNRAQLFAGVEGAMESGARAARDRERGQTGLFGALMGEAEMSYEKPLPTVPDWTSKEKLQAEKEILGFYVTGHPLDEFAEKVKDLATYDSESVGELQRGADVKLCGLVSGAQLRRTKEGKPWASFQLEDLSGTVECVVFASAYEEVVKFLQEDSPVMVKGAMLDEGKVLAQELVPLTLAHVPLPSLISIRVPVGRGPQDSQRATALHELFDRKPGPTMVRLRLEKLAEYSVVLDLESKVRPDREFRSQIEKICGPEALEVLAMS